MEAKKELEDIRKELDKIITKLIDRGDKSNSIYDFEIIDGMIYKIIKKLNK